MHKCATVNQVNPAARAAVKLGTFVSAESLLGGRPPNVGRHSSRLPGRDDICSQRAICRGHGERTIVHSENLGAKRWGIGLGLFLGIVLASLSLTEIPFFGSAPAQPRRQSLPRPQNREAQAVIDPFEQVAETASPTSNAGHPGSELATRSNGKPTESGVPETASSESQTHSHGTKTGRLHDTEHDGPLAAGAAASRSRRQPARAAQIRSIPHQGGLPRWRPSPCEKSSKRRPVRRSRGKRNTRST